MPASQPASEDELRADSAAHEDRIVGGLADGSVPVTGCSCEEEELCDPQEDVEEVLSDTAHEADSLGPCGNVRSHLGHNDCLEPNF